MSATLATRTRPAHPLDLDVDAEIARIVESLRRQTRETLRRRGLVVGLSGGIDSSVCAALAARAVGPGNVLCLYMPEADSDPQSLALGERVARAFGLPAVLEDIAPALEALGCYARRDEAIREVVPDFGPGWGCKVVISDPLGGGLPISWLVVRSPTGETRRVRLTSRAYLAVIAATNMKQRVRKLIEYTHADRLAYAVLGTPNRLEYDQGFFVKNGDGAADVKPIAHLYKTQVYALAERLGIPEEIRRRPPTTDTWSLPQGQDEFYFALPYARMDVCLHGLDTGRPAGAVAADAGLSEDAVETVWRDIAAKRRATRYLHRAPLLAAPVPALDEGGDRKSVV